MTRPADINFLVGRSYAATSGNIALIHRLGDDAIRVYWLLQPSAEDSAEFKEWLVGLVGAAHGVVVELTECTNPENEAAEYEKWRKK